MKLGSLDYMQAVMARTNADEKYRELAKGQYETYTMVIEPEPKRGVEKPVIVGFDIQGGVFAEVWEGQRATMFTLSAPYGVWVDILRGKLGPVKAITMRRLKTQGPFVQLLKGTVRVRRWVVILRTIPTEFEGEYEQYNITGSESG